MKVKELMAKEFMTLSPEDKVDRAVYLFHYEKVHHLPVVSANGKLEGIVANHDLKKVEGVPKYTVHESQDGKKQIVSAKKVRNVMRRNPFTIAPEENAYVAAAIMVNERIGSLPVVHNGELVGIVTSTHILQAFVNLCHLIEPLDELLNRLNNECSEKA